MKRADMIAEIKKKYCGKCPVHLNKMRSSELEGLLRGGGARGGESRLQPQNRIIGKFTPQKAPKTNSNQYEKNIGEKKEIVKTRRRAGELASINARMRTPRPPKLSEAEKVEREKKKIRRRAKRYKKKLKEVRGQFKENEAMGGEDINTLRIIPPRPANQLSQLQNVRLRQVLGDTNAVYKNGTPVRAKLNKDKANGNIKKYTNEDFNKAKDSIEKMFENQTNEGRQADYARVAELGWYMDNTKMEGNKRQEIKKHILKISHPSLRRGF